MSVAKRVMLHISDEYILNGSWEKLCVMVFCEKKRIKMLSPCASAGRDIELKEYSKPSLPTPARFRMGAELQA